MPIASALEDTLPLSDFLLLPQIAHSTPVSTSAPCVTSSALAIGDSPANQAAAAPIAAPIIRAALGRMACSTSIACSFICSPLFSVCQSTGPASIRSVKPPTGAKAKPSSSVMMIRASCLACAKQM